jgi:predicted sulfurtransferase
VHLRMASMAEDRQQILLYYYYAPQKLVDEEIKGLIELHSNLQKEMKASSSSMRALLTDAKGVTGGRIRVSPEGMNGVLSGSNKALR